MLHLRIAESRNRGMGGPNQDPHLQDCQFSGSSADGAIQRNDNFLARKATESDWEDNPNGTSPSGLCQLDRKVNRRIHACREHAFFDRLQGRRHVEDRTPIHSRVGEGDFGVY